ncbi:MAG: hypothetical protein ACYC43_01170 [Burkholderiales bacterium]
MTVKIGKRYRIMREGSIYGTKKMLDYECARGKCMEQEVKTLKLEDLVLWTENPRDSIDEKATDQDIVDRALEDERSKWSLPKLAKEMGRHYDYSELPTVVFHGKKPVVYDGNRRVILGKIKHGLVTVNEFDTASIPSFPNEIPCNVCSKDIALQNVYRKHADTGSWLPLERDVFLHKHMNQEKTPFLIMEESTGLISANPHLNQRFVKEEIFREDILAKLGISFAGERILSKHSPAETQVILDDISKKIKEKEISTRKNRGDVLSVLDPSSQQIIGEHRRHTPREVDLNAKNAVVVGTTKQKQSKRIRTKTTEIFGGPLYLSSGGVSNLYRDIVDLHVFYSKEKNSLSEVFPCLIRMALRLLCEAAAKDCKQDMDKYIQPRFQKAKNALDQDAKTTLSNNNVTEKSIIQLLHTGAHNYTASANMDQTLAVSIIVGAILTASHGKDATK